MMINLLERMLGRKNAVDGGRIVLPVSSLESFLDDKRKKKEEEFSRKVEPLIHETQQIISDIKEKVLEIESTERPDVNERLGKVLATSKPQFLRSMLDLIAQVESKPSGSDARGYVKKLDGFLSDAPKVIIGPGRYLHLAFGEELEAIRKESRLLLEKKNALQKLIGPDETARIRKDGKALEERLMSVSVLGSEEKRLSAQKQVLESQKKALEEKCRAIEKSEGFRNFQEAAIRLEELRKRREDAENSLYNLFASVKKPLKRFTKPASEKNSPHALSLKDMEEYVEKPVETYLANDPAKTKKVFEELRKALADEEHGMKEIDRKKTLERIDYILGERAARERLGALDLRMQEEKALKRLESLTFLSEKKELEKETERICREIHAAASDLERVQKRIHEAGREITALKSGIEKCLSGLEEKEVSLDMQAV